MKYHQLFVVIEHFRITCSSKARRWISYNKIFLYERELYAFFQERWKKHVPREKSSPANVEQTNKKNARALRALGCKVTGFLSFNATRIGFSTESWIKSWRQITASLSQRLCKEDRLKTDIAMNIFDNQDLCARDDPIEIVEPQVGVWTG